MTDRAREEAEMYAAMEADYWREREDAEWCGTCQRPRPAEGCPACGDEACETER